MGRKNGDITHNIYIDGSIDSIAGSLNSCIIIRLVGAYCICLKVQMGQFATFDDISIT